MNCGLQLRASADTHHSHSFVSIITLSSTLSQTVYVAWVASVSDITHPILSSRISISQPAKMAEPIAYTADAFKKVAPFI